MQFTNVFQHPLKTGVTGAWFGCYVLEHPKQPPPPLPQQHIFSHPKIWKRLLGAVTEDFRASEDSPGAETLPWDPTDHPEPEFTCCALTPVCWASGWLCVLSSIAGSSAKPWVCRTLWILLCTHCIRIYTDVFQDFPVENMEILLLKAIFLAQVIQVWFSVF